MNTTDLLRIKSEINIVEHIKKDIELKFSVKNNVYAGYSPFHPEDTMSFYVFPETQTFQDFTSGIGGDIFQYEMKKKHCNLEASIAYIAEKYNIPLHDEEKNEEIAIKERMYEINKEAAIFYAEKLSKSPAEKYLRETRGFDDLTIQSYGLGYAPKSGQLTKHLLQKGFTKEEILSAELATEKNGMLYDFFFDRVIIPIMDENRKVIGFGGRALGDSSAKYLNSRNTPIFFKSEVFYGIYNAKCADSIILCEGYMDTIALQHAGYLGATATLGTALTKDHARILKELDKPVFICYDNDEAGKKATNKAIEILRKEDIKPRIVRINGEKDPDELIKENGPNSFLKYLNTAKTFYEYKAQELEAEGNIKELAAFISRETIAER